MKYAILIVVIGMLALGCTVEAQEPIQPDYSHCTQDDFIDRMVCEIHAESTATAIAIERGAPTPEPTTELSTPIPWPILTPTPTPQAQNTHPVATACSDFADLVHDSWWAMVDNETAQRVMSVPEGQSRPMLELRTYALMNATKDYPVINRALQAVALSRLPSYGGGHQHDEYQFGSFGGDHDHNSGFASALIGARQIDRLCRYYGYETAEVHPDVLVERLCTGIGATRNERVNPAFGSVYGYGQC